jgi:hypothetical protein
MDVDDRDSAATASKSVLAHRVHVVLPDWITARLPGDEVSLPVRGHREAAQVVRVVVPVVLILVGAVLAVAGAILAERAETEGIGTLGTELGAAMLFAGAIFVVVTRVPTVGRIVVLVVTALVGLAAIAAALTFGWDGALLALAMELGVAAVALLVIDVVLVGLVFPRVEDLAAGPDRAVVTLRLRGDRPPAAPDAAADGDVAGEH